MIWTPSSSNAWKWHKALRHITWNAPAAMVRSSVSRAPPAQWGMGDRLYRHHPNQTTRGYVTRQIRGIVGAIKRLFPRTEYNEPQAGLDHFSVRTIATRSARNRSAHTINNRNDACAYRPCRTRSAIYLFQQTPKPCDAGTPRRHHKSTHRRSIGRANIFNDRTLSEFCIGWEIIGFEFTDDLSSRRIRTAFTPDTSDPIR